MLHHFTIETDREVDSGMLLDLMLTFVIPSTDLEQVDPQEVER